MERPKLIKYTLDAEELAKLEDYFTLRECLYWVAYRLIPEYKKYFGTNFNSRFESEVNLLEERFYEYKLKGKVYKPDITEILTPDRMRQSLFPDKEEIKRLSKSCEHARKIWARKIKGITGNARANLFLNFHNSDLTIMGLDAEKGLATEEKNCEIISPNDIIIDCIKWEESIIEATTKTYKYVYVNKASLLKIYEPPEIYNFGNASLVDIVTKSGRRPKYDWPAFHSFLASHIIEIGGVPKTMAKLEESMLSWCSINWCSEPAESDIRKHVCPYYNGHFQIIDDNTYQPYEYELTAF